MNPAANNQSLKATCMAAITLFIMVFAACDGRQNSEVGTWRHEKGGYFYEIKFASSGNFTLRVNDQEGDDEFRGIYKRVNDTIEMSLEERFFNGEKIMRGKEDEILRFVIKVQTKEAIVICGLSDSGEEDVYAMVLSKVKEGSSPTSARKNSRALNGSDNVGDQEAVKSTPDNMAGIGIARIDTMYYDEENDEGGN